MRTNWIAVSGVGALLLWAILIIFWVASFGFGSLTQNPAFLQQGPLFAFFGAVFACTAEGSANRAYKRGHKWQTGFCTMATFWILAFCLANYVWGLVLNGFRDPEPKALCGLAGLIATFYVVYGSLRLLANRVVPTFFVSQAPAA